MSRWLVKSSTSGRSSHEERGLKSIVTDESAARGSRSSHEERGLKWELAREMVGVLVSLLA